MHQRDILLLYDYTVWANERILNAAARASIAQLTAAQTLSGGSLLDTIVHTMSAEEGWRVKCETGVQIAVSASGRMEDFPTLESVRNYWVEVNQARQAYLHQLTDDDLNQTVTLRDRDGRVFVRVLWQPLLHAITHGVHHRAEVAEALTNLGYSPGDLDFEIYLRTRASTSIGTENRNKPFQG